MYTSFYIHWPFCPYRCSYCPFTALAGQDELMPLYHDALCNELLLWKQAKKYELETLYFGGGTPSTYPENLMLDMSAILSTVCSFNDGCEITIEVNPGTLSPSHSETWQKIGINRISLGVQSLNSQTLTLLNRLHTYDDVKNSLTLLVGKFKSISIDLIIGLPGISCLEWEKTLKEVCTWPIQHISIYLLTIHKCTPLYFQLKQKNIKLPSTEATIRMFLYTQSYLQANGFEQYEISNFAKPGHRSRHNLKYWSHKPYLGFGLGACSFDGFIRSENTSSFTEYYSAIEQGHKPYESQETLSDEHILTEKIMLSLRLNTGLHLQQFNLGGSSISPAIKEFVDTLLHEQLVVRPTQDIVVLTPGGMLLENEIATRFCMLFLKKI